MAMAMATTTRGLRPVLALLTAVWLGACVAEGPPRLAPTLDLYAVAQPAGAPMTRIWGDVADPDAMARVADRMSAAMVERWRAAGRPAEGVRQNMLALSGGGPDGAFGAGILTAMSATGERPDFDVVTGISVGALMAPFVFAGPEHDDALVRMFTEFGTEDVAELQLFAVLRGALGIADTLPLRRQIAALVDDALLERIAERSREGALLLIGTTNIDAARPVIWNMGAIAEAGEAALFRDVMLASASIPGAFPPVAIEVEAEGMRFTELHVDGGVTRSVFLGPPGLGPSTPRGLPFPVRRTVFVIQNNGLRPLYEPTPPRIAALVSRSVSALIRAQSEGDLARIAREAQALGAEFRLAYVPPGFGVPASSGFDRDYMTALFEAAQADVFDGGFDWQSAPPSLLAENQHLADLSQR